MIPAEELPLGCPVLAAHAASVRFAGGHDVLDVRIGRFVEPLVRVGRIDAAEFGDDLRL